MTCILMYYFPVKSRLLTCRQYKSNTWTITTATCLSLRMYYVHTSSIVNNRSVCNDTGNEQATLLSQRLPHSSDLSLRPRGVSNLHAVKEPSSKSIALLPGGPAGWPADARPSKNI